MEFRHRWVLLSALASVLAMTLSGCAALLVGGAVAGASVAADQRTTGTQIEDQTIELKAANAIGEDKELSESTHINVTSYNTVVLVSGEAPTEAARQRVIALVRGVDKVRHVHDEIVVAAPSSLTARSNDSLITTKVKTKIFTLENLDATQVKVVTERGVVYLLGLISRKDADRVTEAVRTVSGVQRVVKLFEYTA